MVKHTQNNLSATADELFEYVWSFCGLVLKGFKERLLKKYIWWKIEKNIMQILNNYNAFGLVSVL